MPISERHGKSLHAGGVHLLGKRGAAREWLPQMLSPAELGQVARFAILLMSDSHGADVREAAPPAQ